MRLNLKALPKDSALWEWVYALSITEVPQSYQVVTALSAFGACLRRNVWVDQVEWQVFPNLSVLLVGPSGIGKDIAIRASDRAVTIVDDSLLVGGVTIEALKEQLLKAGDPACGFVCAPEITAFLGSRDYQKSMVQELTDLLSTGDRVDVTLKSRDSGKKTYITRPTVTMQAGSTAEWLHKAMPEGALEGGLLPRFLIVCEEYGSRHVPLIKHSITSIERDKARIAKGRYISFAQEWAKYYEHWPSEISLMPEAVDYYSGWYIDRFNQFSPNVRAYANRSRDQMLRLGMLCALTRGRNYVERDDMVFANAIMQYVANTIEEATVPPSREAQVVREILGILPLSNVDILKTLGNKYSRKQIMEGMTMLMQSERIAMSKEDGRFYGSD